MKIQIDTAGIIKSVEGVEDLTPEQLAHIEQMFLAYHKDDIEANARELFMKFLTLRPDLELL